MKIENIELMQIVTTEKETKEDKKTIYTAIFENKDEGLKVSINQESEFDLVVGEQYSIKVETEQKKL